MLVVVEGSAKGIYKTFRNVTSFAGGANHLGFKMKVKESGNS